ncbi:unnamed protein product, partial [Rotaria magnacalcarata]
MESNQRTELLVSATARTQQLLSNDAPFSFDTVSIYGRHEFRDIFDKPMTKGDSSWFMDQVLCS